MTIASRFVHIAVASVIATSFFAVGLGGTFARQARISDRKPVLVVGGSVRTMELPATGKNASWRDVVRIHALVTTTRAATQKYADVAVAVRDGYRYDPTATGSWTRHGIYVQYTNRHLASRPNSPAAPAGIIYMKMGGALMLSGVGYTMPGNTSVTGLDIALPGTLADWRQRIDVCSPHGTLTAADALRIHVAASCVARGGVFVARGPWTARAWIWLSGAGLFDARPDPMAGMNMKPGKEMPGRTMVMTQGPYQMEMMQPSGKSPTWSDLDTVYRLLSGVKKANDKFRDVNVAKKHGFVTTTILYVPGQGAHYVNPARVFLPLNLKAPPILVYDTVKGKETLKSALFLMPETSTPQQLSRVFPSSMAAWHRHVNNCFTGNKVLAIHDKATCMAIAGAHWLSSTPWMVHAWLWDSASGLFDMDSGG